MIRNDGITKRRQIFVTTSWDDGHLLDQRLAALLRRYGLGGTFYIAPNNVEIPPERRLSASALRELAEDFEIGGHTSRHIPLTSLTAQEAADDIREGKEYLENLLGRTVESFCYPRGKYAPTHVRSVVAAGFRLGRTVRRHSLSPEPAHEMGTTVHACWHKVDGLAALRLAAGRLRDAARLYAEWDEMAMRWFDLCSEVGGVYHLWGHSWEVDAHRDWARLERVLEHVAARPGVRYVDNAAVVTPHGAT